MLELWFKFGSQVHTHNFHCQGSLNIADVSTFFAKKNNISFPKNSTFTKSQCGCVWDFLVLLSVFVRWKVTFIENVRFTDCASGIRLPDYCKLAINYKNYNDVTICWHDVMAKFFWRCFVSLVKFSYWSKFHINIVTCSGVMTIFFYKELTRNPESEITPSEFCAISEDWGELRIPNLAQMFLIRCYHGTILRTGITCKKILLCKSIEFGIPLK